MDEDLLQDWPRVEDFGISYKFVESTVGLDACTKCAFSRASYECMKHPCMPHQRADQKNGYYQFEKQPIIAK